jgi:hypothetical protein
MAMPTREPFVVHLLARAATLHRRREVAPASAEPLELHAQALELLAELVRSLPDDDERMLVLGTLAVRGGQFAPGPGTEHALSQFEATSRDACDGFLTNLVRIARDDAIARARTHGRLPRERPR